MINNPLKYTDPSGQIIKHSFGPTACPVFDDDPKRKKRQRDDGGQSNSNGGGGAASGYSYTNGSPYSSNWGRSFNNVGNYSNITFNGNPLCGGVGGSSRSGGGLNRPFANNGESSPRDILDMSGAVAVGTGESPSSIVGNNIYNGMIKKGNNILFRELSPNKMTQSFFNFKLKA